jgi:hypothetical protein
MVGEPKVWGFGEDKWTQYQTILRDHCDGDFKKIQKMLISVTCQNTDKQQLFITPYPKDDVALTGDMYALAKEKRAMFEDDVSIDRQDVLHTITTLSGGHGQASSASSSCASEDSKPAENRDVEPPSDEPPVAAGPAPGDNVESQIDDVIAGWE